MSAFVVSHDHIDALLTFADQKRMNGRLGYAINKVTESPVSWDEIGRVLLAENLRSVLHRYPQDTEDTAPGKIGEVASAYRFKPLQQLFMMQHNKKIAWILKACDCFDYQACETDDYEQSTAHRIIEAIRSAAIHSLLDYENAPWGIDRDRFAKAVQS